MMGSHLIPKVFMGTKVTDLKAAEDPRDYFFHVLQLQRRKLRSREK